MSDATLKGEGVTVNLRVLVNCMEKSVNQIYKEIVTESASKRRRLRIIKRSHRTTSRLKRNNLYYSISTVDCLASY
jgi:hypothetical protein